MNATQIPPPQSVIWGIDPSSKRFAITVRGIKGSLCNISSVDSDAHPKAPNPTKLNYLHRVVATHTKKKLYDFGFPLVIAIEIPYGAGRNPVLVHAYGVTLAAIASTLDEWTPQIAWLEPESAKWKKEVGLPHNCDADVYCAALRKVPGAAFANHDEAASYWIAEYASRRISVE